MANNNLQAVETIMKTGKEPFIFSGQPMKMLLSILLSTTYTASYALTATYESCADDVLNSKKYKNFWRC